MHDDIDMGLILDSLNEAAMYLNKLRAGIKSYLQESSSSNYGKASKLLAEIIDGLGWELKVLSLIAEQLQANVETDNCRGVFGEVCQAMEEQDCVLINDLFEYEVLPLLNKWEVSLAKMHFDAQKKTMH